METLFAIAACGVAGFFQRRLYVRVQVFLLLVFRWDLVQVSVSKYYRIPITQQQILHQGVASSATMRQAARVVSVDPSYRG